MTKNIFLAVLLFFSFNAFSQSFVSIWNTNNTSTQSPANDQITIPTNPAYTNYNYTVDWGDTNTDTNVTGDITHTYTAPGIYTISISGDFPAIYFNNLNSGDKLKIIEILDWGTIQWQTMENAFYGCQNLNFDAINSPDLSQVTSLKNMFNGGTLFNGIVNDWNISNITDISGLFKNCEVFNRPLDLWDTRSVIDMSETFLNAELFNEPLDNWKTGAVTNMSKMFDHAEKFNQNINNWNVSQVTDMSDLFNYARAFNQPLNNWDVSNVTTMASMFYLSAFNQPINNWTVDNVTDISGMFQNCPFNQPLDNWNVSNVTTLAGTFGSNNNFNQPLNNWDVSNVTNMSGTFGNAGSIKAFNQPLDQWDVSNVTTMAGMFESSSFNQPINSWDVSNVTNMRAMFSGWASFYITYFNQPLDQWDVSNVTDMSDMFEDSSFNQNIEAWDVSNVTSMNNMFFNARQFNQSLNNWTITSLQRIDGMFSRTPLFNQPLDNWDTSSITSMRSVFSAANVFDQDLSSWNISSVTHMNSIFSNSGLSQENYDAILIDWATQSVQENVEFGANNIKYCDGRLARQDLIDNHNWNITGDIVNCTNVFCTTIINPVAGDTNVPANSNIRWEAAPNADGYYIDLEVERAGVRSFVDINGSPADDYDVGNVQILTFTNEFTPGDTIFITVTPYNDEGPAVGCEELSFTVVPSWVNSPDAYKITIDTREGSANGNDRYDFRIQHNNSFNYNYSIDWGDREYNNNVTTSINHIYNTPGIYTIAIIGDFPAPYFYYNGDSDEVISIDQWGTHEYQSMKRACFDCENMEYNATDVPNIESVTDMSEIFRGASKFNGDINNWNVSNVTNMREAFYRNLAFNQPLNTWDVSKVTDMSRMFSGATAFDQNLNSWQTGEVTNMSQMFSRATVFNQPLDNWDVSKVTIMNSMFANTEEFNQNIDIWDVSSVTTTNSMFYSALKFDMPLNDWDVSSVTNTSFMFRDAQAFDRPLNNWNVSSVITMNGMFRDALRFNQNIDSWNVTNVTDMESMFNSALSFNEPLSSWDVNSVVNMSSMFEKAEVFNQPINSWNVSAVANMTSMFNGALIFNQPLNSWDVSSVTLMPYMFEDAAVFNQPLNNWNTSVVTNFEAMFKNALAFNGPLGSWNTGEVLTMKEMFNGASSFNQQIDSWNTAFVNTMESMFEDASTYNQTMNSWNVASVTTMEKMFKGAIAFNSDISAWNVRGVETMEEMFSGASAFNQNINDWRVSGVNNMDYMFNEASSYNQAMDLWNLGNVSMRAAFFNATSLNQNLADWDVSGVSDMRNMLDNTALIRENYDNTLIGWSEQTLTSGITLGAQGLPYCDAQEERQSMITTFGWSFSLDVRDCPIPECTQLASPLDGATDVPVNTNITWDAALFAQGYRLTVGTSSGGNNIVNNATITNETSYEFATDFNTGDIVYITLIPFNDEGDAVGPCIEESFTISNDPATIPDCTNLNQPLNGANDVVVTSDLSWDPISNADGYRLTVGTTTGGNDLVDDEDVGNTTTYEFNASLPEDSDIFVVITPYNGEGDATGCLEESFDTELIPVPPVCTNLISPANNATDVPIDTNLSWTPVSNATGYLVIVGTTPDGIEVANNIDVGSQTTYDIPLDLQEDRLHYVTIIPYNDEGDATGCLEETFTTGNSTSPPSCVLLTVPNDGATAVPLDTNLSWNGSGSADGYRLTVGSSSGGTDIFSGDLGDITTYDLTADLPESTMIYVNITAYNVNGDSAGCSEQSFMTDGPPLCTTLTSPANMEANVAVDVASVSWNASANTDSYFVTIDASISTANNGTFEVTSGTTYNFTNDFERGDVVTVTIVPSNDIGDAVGPCTSESFTIVPPPVPACTTLSSATTDVALRPTIEWNASTGADGYKLTVLASSSTANNVTDLDIPTGTTYTFTNDFEQGETVDITIVPYNNQGDAIGCTPETITIRPVPLCNSLIIPGDQAIDVAIDTNMSWTVVSNAIGYRLTVVASSSTANNVTDLDITSGNTYNFPNDFEQGETVTVTITPYNESGDAIGCASEGWTIKPVPACTNLLTPAAGAADIAVDTNIEWNAIAEATGYKLTVSASSSTANNITDFDVITGNTYTFPSDFEQGETVTVTITPYNEVGDAIGCSSESFTIKPVPTCTNLIAPANGAIDVAVDTDISWTPIADATGYKLTVTASNSTANNLTDFDVTTATSYDFSNDFGQGETVTVTITPYNEVGDAIGCTTESFTIKSIPLCTNLLMPADGEVVAQARDISWNAIANADGYKLTISGSNTTINNITDFEFVGTTYVFPNDFTQGEVVTVTITPFNEVGDAIGCTSESFTIRPVPNCTNLLSPLNNSGQVSVMTDISWNPSFDADGYRVSVGTSPNGTDIVNSEDVASLTSFTFAEDLPSETLIYVTITPYNTSGDAAGCISESFTTEVIIPECTELSSPFNGEVDIPLESTISWNEVEKTDGYRISIGTTPAGTDIVNNQDTGAETSYTHSEEFPFDTEIYVTIISYNSAGDSEQCEVQSFTTLIPEDNTKYGFSPDGDGINEYWHIENIEYYPENMVMIYNRWGDAVFRIDNYDNGQNVFRGEANMKTKMGAGTLPAGTYFFDIQIEGETILQKTKGYVVIKR